MPNKKNTPGCPCCTPTGCNVTINVVACCGPASGATVTIKDGSGTVKGTGTTNSSGSVTISLAGTSGQTLYVFISYETTYYYPYTDVLLGSHCGRSYQYTLQPIGSRSGATCGQVIVKTLDCDGVTPYGGINVYLYQSGFIGPIATGTTNATTGVYTFTGLTVGAVYSVKAGPTPRGQANQITSSFTLVCAEEADFVFNSTYPFVPTGTSCPASYTLKALAGGTFVTCCADCDPITIPQTLTLVDPGCPLTGGSVGGNTIYVPDTACGVSAVTMPLQFNNYSGGIYLTGCNAWFGTISPYAYVKNSGSYALACTGSGIQLALQNYIWCGYRIAGTNKGCGTFAYPPTANYGFVYVNYGGPITAASNTCSPFSATFNVPSITLTMYFLDTSTNTYFLSPCDTYTIPARTITVHE